MPGLAFSDTTGKQGLIQDCETNLSLGDGTISGDSVLLPTFTRLINSWLHEITTMILNSQDDWQFDDLNNSDYPVATTPMVAGQRDYTFPSSMRVLQFLRVDVTYDGTNWYQCNPIDLKEFGRGGLGNDAITDADFDITEPRYDLQANALWLYPMATVAQVSAGAMIRVVYSRAASEFVSTDTTKTPGLDVPFHRFLSLGASFEYAASKSMPQTAYLQGKVQDMEVRLRQYYGIKDADRIGYLGAGIPDYR